MFMNTGRCEQLVYGRGDRPAQVCAHGHMFMNTGRCEQLVYGRGNRPAQVCAHGHMFMNTGPCVYRYSRIDLNLTP